MSLVGLSLKYHTLKIIFDLLTITSWVSNSWNQVGIDNITNTWNFLRQKPFDE
jgi:hypothetical protein